MRNPILVFVFLFLIMSMVQAEPSFFDEAQIAASEGRYEDVTELLTTVIDAGQLESEQLAIAFSNRGIAFSLLELYGPAMQDLKQAIELDPEHLLSLNHLGILAEHVNKDFATAAQWYERAASLGYPASQVNLANLLRAGKGVARNPAAAVKLYEQAAANGYSVAILSLGEMYLRGGVKHDEERAIDILRQAVEDGLIVAHHHLGFAYEHGRGVEQDYIAAREHYEKAAMQGYAPSQGALGYLHRKGLGTKKSFLEAIRWYRLAAEQGDSIAANRLAWLMATCPVKEVCNGKVALEFAKLAVSVDNSATNLDSLAAAYARIGYFDEALAVIQDLLATKDLSPSAKAKYQRRIHRYSNGIPFQI